MSVDLPATENWPARTLARWFSETELSRAITYLELVRVNQISPGQEIEKLLGEDTLLEWTMEEVEAVQRKLALALCIKHGRSFGFITKEIQESVFRNRMEVMRSYQSHRVNYGRTNEANGHGSRARVFGR
jgi:hypothetical protein